MGSRLTQFALPTKARKTTPCKVAGRRRWRAGIILARRKRSGHFWQSRFGGVAMDEQCLAAALRYVSLNPVRARLFDRARDWRSARSRGTIKCTVTVIPHRDLQ
jgi:REP element-mobilizing transposase RayT